MSEESAKALVASYQAYGDIMFENMEYAKAAFDNVNNASEEDEVFIRDTDEAILKFIKHNEELIKS
jgi:hypothetical protein